MNNIARPIPQFEGRPVEGIEIKVGGSAPLEDLNGEPLGIDDRVQMLAIYTVTGVHHKINNRGELVRVQTLNPVEMHLMPFDESDPNDDGIVRALVQGTTSQTTTGGTP